jgi:RimJ/RimL family protein N-acetyltransferase
MTRSVVLETPRLQVRQFRIEDAKDLWALDQDPEVLRYIGDPPPAPPTLKQVQQDILPAFIGYYTEEPGYGFWAAEARSKIGKDKTENAFIGWFHLRPTKIAGEVDLGYRLCRGVWGQGYATEGSLALISLAFSRAAVQRVGAHAMPQNKASVRVMQKAGMEFERRFLHPSGPEVVQYGVGRIVNHL